MTWLEPTELRIGLGCMRLPAESAFETVAAAVEAGVTVFDTARAYEGNERLLARTLRRCGAEERARIVTKGGMARPGGAWVPDGRAKAIAADCEASLAAVDGLPIDLYLVHAPDPRTPWKTSVRALARLADEGLVRRIGIANVNRRQLDEAFELAPVAAVQVALSPFDDRALRGGLVARCDELDITLMAHSPLGGPKRAARVDAAETLAWLLGLSRVVVPIPGARRPETAHSAALAAATVPAPAPFRRRRSAVAVEGDGEVVLVIGIPGAGKSRVAAEYAARGYFRLNRDERGGSLRELAAALDGELAAGARRIVLDNTYLTRAARNDVIEVAARHGIPTRCVWLDTPLAQAQLNLVSRLLERLGSLPTPEQLKELARTEPGVLAPTSQMRAFRELEPPSLDEGFAAVDHVPFVRASQSQGRTGVLVAAGVCAEAGWEDAVAQGDSEAPHLVYDWNPDGDLAPLAAAAERLAATVSGPVETALCPHPAGPPTCWCRPPLPGLPLAFAPEHGIDLSRSTVIGTGPAHRTLATTLGARYVGSP
jgi:aryl-alcohol dehydrogenase-like predicted oxidoreductase